MAHSDCRQKWLKSIFFFLLHSTFNDNFSFILLTLLHRCSSVGLVVLQYNLKNETVKVYFNSIRVYFHVHVMLRVMSWPFHSVVRYKAHLNIIVNSHIRNWIRANIQN